MTDNLFSVIAESKEYDKPMIIMNLPFGRLMDEIVLPYDTEEPFFIDGVPVTKDKIIRIKIVKLGNRYENAMHQLNTGLTKAGVDVRKTYGEQYNIRFEHILRTETDDVTAQVIKAYNTAIKPSLKEYIPNRGELITTANTLLTEGLKLLG